MTDDKNIDNSIIQSNNSNKVKVGNFINIPGNIPYCDISSLFNKAFRTLNSKQTLDDDKDYLYLLETNPQNRRSQKYRNLAIRQDDYREALILFTEVLKIIPKHILSIELSAICNINLRNLTAAIEDCARAIEIDPEYAYAYNNRGFSKASLEDYQNAIEDFSKAIKIDPEYAYATLSTKLCKR